MHGHYCIMIVIFKITTTSYYQNAVFGERLFMVLKLRHFGK
jgi:hypothetical protein